MPIYNVRVSQTTGSPFKPNKNGQFPLVLTQTNGAKITNGGILDGTIAQRLGIVDNGIYTIDITSQMVGEYMNHRHTVVSDLTAAVATALAGKAMTEMFGSATVYSTPTPVADDTNPL